jgi:hypothetical protein
LGFENKVHPSAIKSHEKVAKTEQGTSSNVSQPATSKKRNIAACVNTPDEPVEAHSTSQQEDARSSYLLGGDKHPFPFSQKTHSRRSQRQVKPRVLGEDKKI